MMSSTHEMGMMGWGMMEEGGWRKGPWTTQEDRMLIEYVKVHGEGRWNSVARLAGLRRNGKSCRLRWVNYLRPDLKRGQITPQEETIILELHARWGNRWSTIARSLPGRTDNEIKNYWRTHFKKKAKVSTVDTERSSKTRLLRKQQFQQQQQYHQLEQQLLPQQQQQNDQFTTTDMKWMISLLLGDGENKESNIGPTNTYPSSSCSSTKDQGSFYPTFNYSDGSTSEGSNDELLLWNNNNYGNFVEDFQGNNYWTSICATSTIGVHPSVAPFC